MLAEQNFSDVAPSRYSHKHFVKSSTVSRRQAAWEAPTHFTSMGWRGFQNSQGSYPVHINGMRWLPKLSRFLPSSHQGDAVASETLKVPTQFTPRGWGGFQNCQGSYPVHIKGMRWLPKLSRFLTSSHKGVGVAFKTLKVPTKLSRFLQNSQDSCPVHTKGMGWLPKL